MSCPPLSSPPGSSLPRPAVEARWQKEEFERNDSLLRIACDPGSDALDVVQPFIVSYVELRFRRALAERVSVAAYELFANGLGYGSIDRQVTFELFQRGSLVEVAVSNDAGPSRLRLLAAHVERLRDGAEAVYLEELKRSLAGEAPRAMLGLARVVHEVQMGLHVELSGESRVTVRARASD